jgi:hypothetical protein
MSGDHNQHQKGKSYVDDFECPRCGHCCQVDEGRTNKEAELFELKGLRWHIKPDGDDLRVCFDYSGKPEDKYIRFVRAGQQEPIAWMHTTGTGHVYFRKKPQDKVFNPQPVFTSPPKREWVGLTEKEWYEATGIPRNATLPMHMLKGIEKALKERNG